MGGSLAADQRPDAQPVPAHEDSLSMLLPLVRQARDTTGGGDHQASRRAAVGGQRPQQNQLSLLVRSAGVPREARRHGEPGEEERKQDLEPETNLGPETQDTKLTGLVRTSRPPDPKDRNRERKEERGGVKQEASEEGERGEDRREPNSGVFTGTEETLPPLEDVSPLGRAKPVVEISDQEEEGVKDRPSWSEIEAREKSEERNGEDFDPEMDLNMWDLKACSPETFRDEFPPTPPRPSETTWSLDNLIRPAKKAMDWWRSPKKRPMAEPDLPQGSMAEKNANNKGPRSRRGDLPERREDRDKCRRKELRGRATKLAKKYGGLKHSIESSFFSKNSERPRISRRKTIEKILVSAGKFDRGLLTVDIMKTLASALKEAGYKSGLNYLIESKMWHLEAGGQWDCQLDRTFKLCKKGLERGKGPTKKAPEVPKSQRELSKELLWRASTCVVKFPHLLFLFGLVWMLREIEIAAFSTEDILVDYVGRKVTLIWRESKKDPEAKGMRRTLQCLCGPTCANECPFKVTVELIKAVENFNGTESPIALTRRRQTPSKNLMVKAWTRTFKMTVGGHSARRTGALSYIRAGWDVGQVAYLGRWKSNIILEYAKEALEEMPVNSYAPRKETDLYPARCLDNEESLISLKDTQDKTKQEVNKMKSDVKAVQKKVEDTVKQLEKWAETGEYLPGRVQSTHSKVVHANRVTLAVSPPFSWRTKCGWHYHFSHYVFVSNPTEVTCAKCKAAQ